MVTVVFLSYFLVYNLFWFKKCTLVFETIYVHDFNGTHYFI